MNANIPRFQCWVRDRYLYGLDDRATVTPGVAFAVASIPGRALGFHVLLKNGAQIGRLPPSALLTKLDKNSSFSERLTHQLQLWNCFSYQISVIEYDFLQAMRCQVILRTGEKVPGAYMFTVDWHGDVDSEDVGDLGWKCGHVIALDDGNIAVQPNNRIRWMEPSFIDPLAAWPPDYKTINYIQRCEQYGRWIIQDEGMFFTTEEEDDV